MGVFALVLVFVLGAVVALGGALFGAVYFLNKTNKKTKKKLDAPVPADPRWPTKVDGQPTPNHPLENADVGGSMFGLGSLPNKALMKNANAQGGGAGQKAEYPTPLPRRVAAQKFKGNAADAGKGSSNSEESVSDLGESSVGSVAKRGVGMLSTASVDAELPDLSNFPVMNEGYLTVFTSKVWKKRWFVLCGNELLFYRSKVDRGDKKAKVLGSVFVNGCVIRIKSSSGKHFVFEMVHSEKRAIVSKRGSGGLNAGAAIVLRTKNESEMQKWVKELSMTIDSYKEDGPVPDSHLLDPASVMASSLTPAKDDWDKVEDASIMEDVDDKNGGDDDMSEGKNLSSHSNSNENGPSSDQESNGPKIIHEGELQIRMSGKYASYWCVVSTGILAFYRNATSDQCVGIFVTDECRVRGAGAGHVDDDDDKDEGSVRDSGKKKKEKGSHHLKKLEIELSHSHKSKISRSMTFEGVMLPTSVVQSKSYVMFRAPDVDAFEVWVDALIQSIPVEEPAGPTEPLKRPIGNVEMQNADFINVLLLHHFKDMAASKIFLNELLRKLSKKMDGIKRPGFLGPLSVSSLSLGDHMLNVDRISITPGEPNEVIGLMDVSYGGGFTIVIATEIYINWPRERQATIQVEVKVTLESLSGRFHLYLPPELQSRMSLAFESTPESKWSVKVNLGDRGVNVAVLPKVGEFLVNAIKKGLSSALTHPNKITLHIPFPGRKLDVKVEKAGRPKKKKTTLRALKAPGDSTSAIAMKFVVGRFFDEVLNRGDTSVVSELFLDDIVAHGLTPLHDVLDGIPGLLSGLNLIHVAFPDIMFSVVDVGVESSNVIARWSALGTFKGKFWGKEPTGKAVELRGVFVAKIKYNMFMELWCYWEPASLWDLSK